MHSELRRFDLNLLLVFDALYRHRSVSAAANELAMSPSALSHALARLRTAMSDELFVRLGNEMQATVRTERIATSVADALELLSNGLSRTRRFDPLQSRCTFDFAASEYAMFAMLPPLIARMQVAAPTLRFRFSHAGRQAITEDLAAGQIDFVLSHVEDTANLPVDVEQFAWLVDDYVAVVSQDHPRIRDGLSLDDYMAARHVTIMSRNEPRDEIDDALTKLGLQRNVSVQLPTVLAAANIIAQSELLMTVPRHVAATMFDVAPLAIYSLPFTAPQYTLKVYCHIKHLCNDSQSWMREQLRAMGSASSAAMTN